MENIKGMCRNEDCEMCDQIQEAEKSYFKCEKCGNDLIPFGNKTSVSGGGINKKVLGIILGVVVLAIVGALLLLGGSSDKSSPKVEAAPAQQVSAVAPVDSDSIKAAQLRVKDSLQAVADSLAALVANPPKQQASAPVAKPTYSGGSGSKDLGYAVFKGSWPNDVNGRMIFKSSHVIDSRDSKGRVAEAGDYVIGEFSDGHLVQGIWYGADNQVKGSIIIGK